MSGSKAQDTNLVNVNAKTSLKRNLGDLHIWRNASEQQILTTALTQAEAEKLIKHVLKQANLRNRASCRCSSVSQAPLDIRSTKKSSPNFDAAASSLMFSGGAANLRRASKAAWVKSWAVR